MTTHRPTDLNNPMYAELLAKIALLEQQQKQQELDYQQRISEQEKNYQQQIDKQKQHYKPINAPHVPPVSMFPGGLPSVHTE